MIDLIGRAKLETVEEYNEAMCQLEQVFAAAKKGTPEGDKFELLAKLISDWEEDHSDDYLPPKQSGRG